MHLNGTGMEKGMYAGNERALRRGNQAFLTWWLALLLRICILHYAICR